MPFDSFVSFTKVQRKRWIRNKILSNECREISSRTSITVLFADQWNRKHYSLLNTFSQSLQEAQVFQGLIKCPGREMAIVGKSEALLACGVFMFQDYFTCKEFSL